MSDGAVLCPAQESSSETVEPHPTGRKRYHSKQPPTVDQPLPETIDDSDIPRNRLHEKETKDLHKHHLDGHATYHPGCESCRLSRGIKRHRRSQGEFGIELQADFAVLSSSSESRESVKVLCLVERESNAVGYIAMTSDYDKNCREVAKWAESVGIVGPSSAVILVKGDMEPSLLALLRKSIPGKVEAVGPQSHEEVGAAEKTVRDLKEKVSCLRHAAQTFGYDYNLDVDTLIFLTRYIATTHNWHHKVRGGDKTPSEIITGSTRSEQVTAVFGSVVFAECPLSVESPAGTRWIPGAFLGPQYGSRASLVSAIVGPSTNPELKVFVAKSIKVLDKIIFETKYAPSILFRLPDSSRSHPRPSWNVERPAHVLPPAMPKSGPPANWLREHGYTKGCSACSNRVMGGKHHNRACKQRYLDWCKQQESNPSNVSSRPPSALPRAGSHPEPAEIPIEDPPIPEAASQEEGDSDYTPSLAPDDMDVDVDESDDGMEVDEGVRLLMSQLCSYDDISFYNTCSSPPILAPLYLPKVGEPTEFTPYKLSGKTVYLAKPSACYSEEGEKLSLEGAIAGRKVELEALNDVSFGTVIDKPEAEAYCRKHNIKILGTRWVCNSKLIDNKPGVRCRLVVQEIASGSASAASLGISSSTPSGESLRCLLTLAATENYYLHALDVSTAFMHSPLASGQHACVRLPGDVSADPTIHRPKYAILHNALNGLRSASLSWLEMARKVLRTVGLKSSPTETTVFAGEVKIDGKTYHAALLIYVDDILIVSKGAKVYQVILEALQKVVRKVKVQGSINPSQEGSLTFLGKEIFRKAGSGKLYMRVPPSYLESICKPLKSSDIPPNIMDTLEKSNKPELEAELSPEKATLYRSQLGRIAWWLQSRPDLSRYGSLLATGQKTPLVKHELCLNRFARYLKSQLHLHQAFPSPNFDSFTQVREKLNAYPTDSLVVFTDASWGSQESTQRRSCSGYVIFWRNCLLKGVSRLQTSIALSSCESETISLLHAAQESCGIRQLVEFIKEGKPSQNLAALSELEIEDFHLQGPPILFVTDSSSARDVILGDGLSRRTRHLSIAVHYIQSLVKKKAFIMLWTPGVLQLADTLTKILQKNQAFNIREALGYIEIIAAESWQLAKLVRGHLKPYLTPLSGEVQCLYDVFEQAESFLKKRSNGVVFVELCTKSGSGFGNLHLKHVGQTMFFIIQVTKQHDVVRSQRFLVQRIKDLKEKWPKKPLVVFGSPPCTGGSPEQFLRPEGLAERLQNHWKTFVSIFKSMLPIFSLGDLRILELSRHCSYWKSSVVNEFLNRFELSACSYFHRCAYDQHPGIRAKHTYRIQSSFPLNVKLVCRCETHQSFSQQQLESLGAYPRKMTVEIGYHVDQAIHNH